MRQSQRLAAAPSSCLSLPRAPQGPVQSVPFSSEACHGWGKAGVGTGVPADSRKPAVTEPSPPAPRVGGGVGEQDCEVGRRCLQPGLCAQYPPPRLGLSQECLCIPSFLYKRLAAKERRWSEGDWVRQSQELPWGLSHLGEPGE